MAYEASQRPPWYAFLKCLVPVSQQAGGADADAADGGAADGRKTVRFEESREEMERRAAISIQRKYRGRSQQLSLRIRLKLKNLPQGRASAAVARGLDGISELMVEVLGLQVWSRSIHNAPDDWEEEQMLAAMTYTLLRPAYSPYTWLLAKPTKYERALLSMYADIGAAAAANVEAPAAQPSSRQNRRLEVSV